MAGRSSVNFAIALIAVAGMLVPAILLIPRFGASGAAGAWTISMVIQNLLLLGYARKHLHLSAWAGTQGPRLLAAVLAITVPATVPLLIRGDDFAALVASCLLTLMGLSWSTRHFLVVRKL